MAVQVQLSRAVQQDETRLAMLHNVKPLFWRLDSRSFCDDSLQPVINIKLNICHLPAGIPMFPEYQAEILSISNDQHRLKGLDSDLERKWANRFNGAQPADFGFDIADLLD